MGDLMLPLQKRLYQNIPVKQVIIGCEPHYASMSKISQFLGSGLQVDMNLLNNGNFVGPSICP